MTVSRHYGQATVPIAGRRYREGAAFASSYKLSSVEEYRHWPHAAAEHVYTLSTLLIGEQAIAAIGKNRARGTL
jgi:hypothetical protein